MHELASGTYLDSERRVRVKNPPSWSQMNVHGRFWDDIKCTSIASNITAAFRQVSDAINPCARRKRGGPRAKKRETEIEIAFIFSPIDDGDYGGAPPTPAPVAMFE